MSREKRIADYVCLHCGKSFPVVVEGDFVDATMCPFCGSRFIDEMKESVA